MRNFVFSGGKKNKANLPAFGRKSEAQNHKPETILQNKANLMEW